MLFGNAPILVAATWPSLNRIIVGMPRTPNLRGVCGFSCNPSYTLCGGVCTNVLTDPNNCNGCGTMCSAPKSASSGGACTCPASTPSYCTASSSCVNFQTDPLNCGSCGHVCAFSSFCQNGSCTAAPVPLAVQVDPDADPAVVVATADPSNKQSKKRKRLCESTAFFAFLRNRGPSTLFTIP